jgi:putative transposase
MLAGQFPRGTKLMASASEDLFVFQHFPQHHWRMLWSANLLERVNEEIKCCTRVVTSSPTTLQSAASGNGATGAGLALST